MQCSHAKKKRLAPGRLHPGKLAPLLAVTAISDEMYGVLQVSTKIALGTSLPTCKAALRLWAAIGRWESGQNAVRNVVTECSIAMPTAPKRDFAQAAARAHSKCAVKLLAAIGLCQTGHHAAISAVLVCAPDG